jgi:hypothetical protein
LDGVSNFPSTLQEFGSGKLGFFIVKVFSNLPVLLVSASTAIVSFWNYRIDIYVYEIFGFVNKYLVDNGASSYFP